ncbi:hypothetical protein CEB3_c45130 [Peptococcaceae bacterium CEB3]|nr:hypothetical protein CEB3_c45130 [Peptococcaceae bacterium CEB3]
MNIRFVKNEAGANRQLLMEYTARLTGIGDDLWEEHILNGVHYNILSNNAEIGYFTDSDAWKKSVGIAECKPGSQMVS